ncbi:MAG TPA: hypothetical protein PL029_04630, partial [Bacteroidia bacterium]|nr:hypothetical protein [Bacteroidia bacterium]
MKLNSVYLKFLVVFTLVFATSFLNAQWIQQTNMVGPARSGAVSWVLNNKLYVVGGGPGQSLQEFDPATGGWMVKTALPWGAAYRYLGVGFTISGKGYICTGTDGAGGYTTDL